MLYDVYHICWNNVRWLNLIQTNIQWYDITQYYTYIYMDVPYWVVVLFWNRCCLSCVAIIGSDLRFGPNDCHMLMPSIYLLSSTKWRGTVNDSPNELASPKCIEPRLRKWWISLQIPTRRLTLQETTASSSCFGDMNLGSNHEHMQHPLHMWQSSTARELTN